jgi:hypothetical protein
MPAGVEGREEGVGEHLCDGVSVILRNWIMIGLTLGEDERYS